MDASLFRKRLSLVLPVAFLALVAVSQPLSAADPGKVIRHAFPAAETGFDPAGAQDLYSAQIEQVIFETLLSYDYLARPAKIVGLDELAEAAKKGAKFDYDKKIPGLEAVDRYTLRIRLKQTDFNLPFVLAHETTSAVAREVIEKYADESGRAMSNPVGTGPYVLKDWVRSSKIILEANPGYRGFVWDFKPGNAPEDKRLITEMKGKKMPQVGRVEISIIEEDQARLLAFEKGELDIMNMEAPLAPMVLDGATLKPSFAKRGVKLSRFVDPEITYHYWNMQDPIVGGMSKEKIALRRAMAMAFNVDDEIRIVRNGQAVEAQYPIPPGVVGHDPKYRTNIKFDPAAANALL